MSERNCVLTEDQIAAHALAVDTAGYTIIENAVEPGLVEELTASLERIERDRNIRPSGNPFEGKRTVRIYNLLAYGMPYLRIPIHENVLPVVERVLDRGCLVSSLSSIAIDPGESAQPVHADDQLIPLPKPHPPLVCNTMWALTDFTDANGATRIIPGSHKADCSPEYGRAYESMPAEMACGSVLVWHGSLWHGGGANRSKARRTGIAMNYCAGYIRQQENQVLGVPETLARTFPPRLLELMGYGIYHGLVGHIEKKTAAERILDRTLPTPIVWDDPDAAQHE